MLPVPGHRAKLPRAFGVWAVAPAVTVGDVRDRTTHKGKKLRAFPGAIPRSCLGLGFVVAALVASGTGARAADHDELIRQGLEARRAGDDAGALKRFQEAYALRRTPRALAQIGFAEQALGRWAAADQHLREAQRAADDPWIQKTKDVIENSLAFIDERIGRLDVAGSPAGAEVRVDGELMGQLPLASPLRVAAGSVVVEVRAPGYYPATRSSTVRVKGLTRETFNLQAAAPAAAADASPTDKTAQAVGASGPSGATAGGSASATPQGGAAEAGVAGAAAQPDAGPVTSRAAESGSSRRVLAFTAGGLSVVALALGIVEHVRWQDKASSFHAQGSGCGDDLPDRGRAGCKDLYDSGKLAKTLTFVGYGAAATFALTATILYLTDAARDTRVARVACAPTLHQPGAGCAFTF
jgi:hypothetical protein